MFTKVVKNICIYQAYRKQMRHNYINNYYKYEWIKSSTKDRLSDRIKQDK